MISVLVPHLATVFCLKLLCCGSVVGCAVDSLVDPLCVCLVGLLDDPPHVSLVDLLVDLSHVACRFDLSAWSTE